MDEAPYPLGPRVSAGLGALLLGVLFLGLQPLGLVERGHPLAAAATVLTALPLVAFLALLAAAPAHLQRLLSRVSRADLRRGSHVAALVVLAGTLFLVIGLGSLVEGAYAYETLRAGTPEEEAFEIDPALLAAGLVQNLIVLIVPVAMYVALVHDLDVRGTFRALGLRREGAAYALLLGVAVAFLFLLGLMVVGAVLQALDATPPENERALAIARSVTLGGALALAIISSVSEEIFFRGFLQPRVGLVAQAVIFALAHLNYVNALELAVTFSLGLAFGLMMRRNGNLWGPIAAHFTFNLVMLLIGIYGEDLAKRFEPQE